MRVDVHNHVLPERAIQVVTSDPVYRVTYKGGKWSGGADYLDMELVKSFTDPAAKLAELKAKGLDAAIVSAAPKPLCYYDVDVDAAEKVCEATNIGLEEFCRYDPQRFHWMAHLPLQSVDRSIAVLRRARAAGCVGVLMGTCIGGRRLDEDQYGPLWAAVEELGVGVFLHPVTVPEISAFNHYDLASVIGFPLEVTIAAERLICSGTFARHPGLRLILGIGGGSLPYTLGRLRHSATVHPEVALYGKDPKRYFGQIGVDTNLSDVEAVRYLIHYVGVGNVYMGTDLPFWTASPEPMLELRKAVGDDEDMIRKITETNAQRFFRLPKAAGIGE